ncbi:polysaccharide biosynthesis/export family protein [Erythrobacter sp. Alg231-14]|uniref:polysaccharide biosynthesis/export family protein n=1 Tax=Erythrobacter sp. Alg231-14 TaxID=1922225 RepID=UPI00307BAAB8
MTTFTKASMLALTMSATLVAGCVSGPAPSNRMSSVYAPQQVAYNGSHQPQGDWIQEAPVGRGAPTCDWAVPRELDTLRRVAPSSFLDRTAPLGAGDRLEISILGDDDRISGTYVIDSDGSLALRGLSSIQAANSSIDELTNILRSQLVSSGIVRPLRNAVRVALIEASGASVAVSGAVFQPGAVRAGDRTPESRIGLREGAVSGDDNTTRTIAGAIRAAGGVRPDADVQRIYLVRGRTYAEFDLSGFIHGWTSRDVAIATGDRVIVPSRTCFDADLVRPTPLTAPGIRVYMSNLTQSANNNAGAAIGEKTGSLPYGTRLLQGLVAANCVGGSYMQSDRRAVLISRNPINGESIVVERDIERLVRNANRDSLNPYLMPDDAIACYDSRWSNFREAVGLISQGVSTATPAILLDNAL